MAETRKSAAKAGEAKSRKKLVTAAATAGAIGIGSAALVAALLYANRDKDDAKAKPASDPRFEPDDS